VRRWRSAFRLWGGLRLAAKRQQDHKKYEKLLHGYNVFLMLWISKI
jgi:hypothetical protein